MRIPRRCGHERPNLSPLSGRVRRHHVKRTPLHRKTPLRRTRPLRRSKPIRQRSRKPRDRGEYSDPLYLTWLRTRPCRVHGCRGESCARHLRHDKNGAALGAHIKDDRRAISLCHRHHVVWLHSMPWRLRELVQCELREWQDSQLAEQRAEYQRTSARCDAVVS